jgi:hypothetical protein
VFDFPSDHEIDGHLLSESDAIKAVLSNRKLGTRLKSVRCTTTDSFVAIPKRRYPGIKFVHLGGHASPTGLGFIGGSVKWADVAAKLCEMFPPLADREERVMTLSCCHSKHGVDAMGKLLKGRFTAIYFFRPESVGFSTAIATWSMFYLKKRLSNPLSAIMKDINSFM